MNFRWILIVVLSLSIIVAGTSVFAQESDGVLPLSLKDYLGEQSKYFEQALDAVNMKPSQVKFDRNDMRFFGGDKYLLHLMDVFFDNPWKISTYSRTISGDMLKGSANHSNILMGCQRRLSVGARLGLIGDPLESVKKQITDEKSDNLALAISKVSGRSFKSYLTADYKNIPPAIRDQAALFMYAIPEILKLRERGLIEPLLRNNIDPQGAFNTMMSYVINEGSTTDLLEDPDNITSVLLAEKMMDNIDWNLLHLSSGYASVVTQNISTELDKITDADLKTQFCFKVETPLGLIVIANDGNTTYPKGNYLLVIDLSGADKYETVAGNSDIQHPISVCFDLKGNDIYSNSEQRTPSFGAGFFGYACLVDSAGADHYYNRYFGQGSGLFGSGILQDKTGDDVYDGFCNVQGSGSFGIGVLIDNDGSDKYSTYAYSQGYGYTKSVGLLLDPKGNDIYYANNEDIKFAGPFGDFENMNMSQGFGYGRRADFTDGHSWAGGIGMLFDGEGNDKYISDVYSQGSAYWYGMGILIDKKGNDMHEASTYSIAGCPHFAIGIVQDDEGDDKYLGYMHRIFGHGRDWCIGWFEESAGNDLYVGTTDYHFGTGDTNAIGIFWEKAGNDTYYSCGKSFGSAVGAESLRNYMLSLGIFVDGSGFDKYYELPQLKGYNVQDSGFTPDGKRIRGFADYAPYFELDKVKSFEYAINGKIWKRMVGTEPPGTRATAIDAP